MSGISTGFLSGIKKATMNVALNEMFELKLNVEIREDHRDNRRQRL